MAKSKPQLRVNKATFLESVVCHTRGWLTRRGGGDEPSEGDQLRMDEGLEIGHRARSLYPSGVLVDEVSVDAAAKRTQKLMADRRVRTIFEAAFLADQFVAKADILVRSGRGWKLLEVKSSINPKPELWEDLAYTLMVARRAGVKVNAAALLLISPDYRLGMDDRELFAEHNGADEAWEIADTFDEKWETVPATALAHRRPKPSLIFACRGCPYFGNDCHHPEETNHIFDLPRLSESLFKKLTNLDATTILHIPEEIELSPSQERVRQAVVTGNPLISKRELAEFLERVEWPAYFLDFETVKSAIPLFPGIAPHEQIVTQYSLHVCHAPGKVKDHREFLADPSGDQRRELAERLVQDLEDHGSIVVYSSFEKTMLGNLAKLFPDLRKPLQRCVERLFDLERAFRDHFYHPEFRGRTSIKVTLPTLVGDTYDGLDIGDGDTAVARYARMVRGEITGAKAEAVREALLAYCKQDTHGMVRLHEELVRHVGRSRPK